MSSKTEEWEELYNRLIALLSVFGKDHSQCADCDYSVIDDEYDIRKHKIEIIN